MEKKWNDNLILKVLSVVMAILIWIVVVNIEDPSKTRTITGIKVEVENDTVITENNQVYTITEGQLISVKVTGPRTIVDSLRADDFVATADFKDLSVANSVPINVELKEYENQQRVTINEKSNNTLRLEIEDLEEQTYHVQVKYTGTVAESYVVAETKLETEQVKVTAPESVHDSIKEVSVSVNINDVSQDFEQIVPVKVYNDKGVELIQADNHVTTDKTQIKTSNVVYYTKKVPVSYEEINEIGNNMEVAEVQLSSTELNVMGRKETLDQLSQIVLPTEGITSDQNQNELQMVYDVKELLPNGVYLNDSVETITLTITLEEITDKTISLNVANIGIRNIPNGMDASIVTTGKVSITLRGTKQLLDEINADSVNAYVSLKNLGEGVFRVPVEISLNDGIRMISEVYVDVNIRDAQNENPNNNTTGNEPGTDQTTTDSTSGQENSSSAEEESTTPEETETTTEESESSEQEET